ncbi:MULTISPECIES: anti-phage deoxyguanosine triphosphatase [unclassified Burkholderia]|uniref:anti-phage deoxyguanosine triphosphatase n=1 Tax=unclassified Burkholderia TaxID=2613784 RepID=UPI000B79C608|nr:MULTISPECIES: anti-phage deoxyguanosine triphosphatase [unclassified Burkholderia]OXI40159.1 dGTPase [Burkholderia sp. AU17457]
MQEDVWQERREASTSRPNDVRSEWERDYARLIHSSAFRRLQSKTQVLGLGESDFYRTRLTHSMEVAQIGVGIVRWLKSCHQDDVGIASALPDDALMSSICLAHDIGHPPFGHGGEVALNICMRDFGGFEGNGQTLRILSRLDKYTEGHGLNPTRRLMLGILKYPASYEATVVESHYGVLRNPAWLSKAEEQHPPKCYMDDEHEVVEWIFQPLSSDEKLEFARTEKKFEKDGGRKHNKPINKALDTSIMELADDISYSLHDLEDAISLRMVTRKDWKEHNEGHRELFSDCNLDDDLLAEELFADESYRRKKTIGGLVHGFITNTKIVRSGVSAAMCDLVKWNAEMEPSYENLLRHIFELVKIKVIKSSNVQQLEFKGQKLIIELFDAINSDPERLLPSNALRKYREVRGDAQMATRIVCDFIAGMTDEYAARLYEKLYYPHKGSIFDRL